MRGAGGVPLEKKRLVVRSPAASSTPNEQGSPIQKEQVRNANSGGRPPHQEDEGNKSAERAHLRVRSTGAARAMSRGDKKRIKRKNGVQPGRKRP